jgi:hypothetical protein
MQTPAVSFSAGAVAAPLSSRAAPAAPFSVSEGLPASTVRLRRMLVADADRSAAAIAAAIQARGSVIDDFASKRQPSSRAKALGRLRAAFAAAGARFMWATVDRPNSIACWAFLKHRSAKDWTEADAHPRDRQECVVVYHLLAGKLPNGSHAATGRWSIEFSHHCLARLCEAGRTPLGLTPAEAIWAGHDRVLRSSVKTLRLNSSGALLLDIGFGSFVLEVETRELDGQPIMLVVGRTWLPPHLRSDLPRLPPAAELDDMAGVFWLAPRAARKFSPDGRIEVPAAMLAALEVRG